MRTKITYGARTPVRTDVRKGSKSRTRTPIRQAYVRTLIDSLLIGRRDNRQKRKAKRKE